MARDVPACRHQALPTRQVLEFRHRRDPKSPKCRGAAEGPVSDRSQAERLAVPNRQRRQATSRLGLYRLPGLASDSGPLLIVAA